MQRTVDFKSGDLGRFATLVVDANRKINLVSRSGDVRGEIDRQIRLSRAILPLLPQKYLDRELDWFDIGSGGGFPAIPLAIERPQDRFLLVEAIAKKAFFLERTAFELKLTNVEVLKDRIEQVIAGSIPTKRKIDIVTIKAVAGLQASLSWASEILKSDGLLVTYKTADEATEDVAFELIVDQEVTELSGSNDLRIMIFKKK